MFLFFFFSFSSAWSVASIAERAIGFDVNDTCTFTRLEALACIVDYVDFDRNGQISEQEFLKAQDMYIPYAAKKLEWLVSKFGLNIDYKFLMKQCDYNKDGILSAYDFLHSGKTCLINQGELCLFESVCKRAQAVAEPLKTQHLTSQFEKMQ